jgi:DNA-binding beta-propeller fold protein YncE
MNHRIDAFAPNGKRLVAWGSRGSAPGELRSPTGIAVGKDGAIYVVDTGNAWVEKFSSLS